MALFNSGGFGTAPMTAQIPQGGGAPIVGHGPLPQPPAPPMPAIGPGTGSPQPGIGSWNPQPQPPFGMPPGMPPGIGPGIPTPAQLPNARPSFNPEVMAQFLPIIQQLQEQYGGGQEQGQGPAAMPRLMAGGNQGQVPSLGEILFRARNNRR